MNLKLLGETLQCVLVSKSLNINPSYFVRADTVSQICHLGHGLTGSTATGVSDDTNVSRKFIFADQQCARASACVGMAFAKHMSSVTFPSEQGRSS
jgi:hypothetical protein